MQRPGPLPSEHSVLLAILCWLLPPALALLFIWRWRDHWDEPPKPAILKSPSHPVPVAPLFPCPVWIRCLLWDPKIPHDMTTLHVQHLSNFPAHLCDPSEPVESGVIFDVPVITQDLGIKWGHKWPLASLCISESLMRALYWLFCFPSWPWTDAQEQRLQEALRRPSMLTSGLGFSM